MAWKNRGETSKVLLKCRVLFCFVKPQLNVSTRTLIGIQPSSEGDGQSLWASVQMIFWSIKWARHMLCFLSSEAYWLHTFFTDAESLELYSLYCRDEQLCTVRVCHFNPQPKQKYQWSSAWAHTPPFPPTSLSFSHTTHMHVRSIVFPFTPTFIILLHIAVCIVLICSICIPVCWSVFICICLPQISPINYSKD